jgi:hypothetical protein
MELNETPETTGGTSTTPDTSTREAEWGSALAALQDDPSPADDSTEESAPAETPAQKTEEPDEIAKLRAEIEELKKAKEAKPEEKEEPLTASIAPEWAAILDEKTGKLRTGLDIEEIKEELSDGFPIFTQLVEEHSMMMKFINEELMGNIHQLRAATSKTLPMAEAAQIAQVENFFTETAAEISRKYSVEIDGKQLIAEVRKDLELLMRDPNEKLTAEIVEELYTLRNRKKIIQGGSKPQGESKPAHAPQLNKGVASPPGEVSIKDQMMAAFNSGTK